MPPKTRRQTRRGGSTKGRGRGRGRAAPASATEQITSSAVEASNGPSNPDDGPESPETPRYQDQPEDTLKPDVDQKEADTPKLDLPTETTPLERIQQANDAEKSHEDSKDSILASAESSNPEKPDDEPGATMQASRKRPAQMITDETDVLPNNDHKEPVKAEETQAAENKSLTDATKTPEQLAQLEDKIPETKEDERVIKLREHITSLRATLADLRHKQAQVLASLKPPHTPSSAHDTIKRHISLLHQYNDMRDIGTGLLGLIAESRGVRVRDVFQDFGLEESD